MFWVVIFIIVIMNAATDYNVHVLLDIIFIKQCETPVTITKCLVQTSQWFKMIKIIKEKSSKASNLRDWNCKILFFLKITH